MEAPSQKAGKTVPNERKGKARITVTDMTHPSLVCINNYKVVVVVLEATDIAEDAIGRPPHWIG